jgi:hypothetical protein
MSNSIVSQVPKNLLFRYRLPCRRIEDDATVDLKMGDEFRLPHFGAFEGQAPFADVRAGWNPGGLLVTIDVSKKKQSLWCRQNEVLESDGLQLWIDTRNTTNVHRASKFCHWFVFLPTGGGPQSESPVATMLKINRSNEVPPTVNRRQDLVVGCKISKQGYRMTALIPASTLHGWNTDDHRQLGFNYAVADRELGWQTLAIGPELPIREDPSLWQTLALAE